MKKSMTIEQLDRVLSHEYIDVRPYSVGDESITRGREILVNRVKYWIEWWCNGCHLYTDMNIYTRKEHGMRIDFSMVSISMFSTSLIFKSKSGDVCAELRIK